MKAVFVIMALALAIRPDVRAGQGYEVMQPVVPVLKGCAINPVMGFVLPDGGPALEKVSVSLAGTERLEDVGEVALLPGPCDPSGPFGAPLARARPDSGGLVTLVPGPAGTAPGRIFWVSVSLDNDAPVGGRVALRLTDVTAGGQSLSPPAGKPPENTARTGIVLRRRGEDGSHSYRIPGLVRTRKGTLVATYDTRWRHCADLPARIDVGVSRSADGGRSWSPMAIALSPRTMGPGCENDGAGDAAILSDDATGRLWIAAFWSHGDHGWRSSGPGLSPEQTGQLLVVHSDDDGLTWSPPRSITPEVKNPAWHLFFDGPGAGIRMRDGTLVFAAQFRSADGGETKGKPFSTILWSKDRGITWQVGEGARIDTTEAQVAELEPGTLMLNCRDNRGGSRSVLVTRDLGRTWQPHPTDRKSLPEPVCMASLLRWDSPLNGPLLLFSNPASTRSRSAMTLKISGDLGATWPEKWHTLYDSRTGSGYSCVAPADDSHVGVLYEGACELYFLRVPLAECLRGEKDAGK